MKRMGLDEILAEEVKRVHGGAEFVGLNREADRPLANIVPNKRTLPNSQQRQPNEDDQRKKNKSWILMLTNILFPVC